MEHLLKSQNLQKQDIVKCIEITLQVWTFRRTFARSAEKGQNSEILPREIFYKYSKEGTTSTLNFFYTFSILLIPFNKIIE